MLGSLFGKNRMKVPSKYEISKDSKYTQEGWESISNLWVSIVSNAQLKEKFHVGGESRHERIRERTRNITFMVTLSAISMTGPTGNENKF